MGLKLQGAIIAAGRGERLRRSGGMNIPKPLVVLGGQTLLARQTRAMLAAGAESVVAVINSETAASARDVELPDELRIIVRDTPNSMETLLELRAAVSSQRFLLATVDAIVPEPQYRRFVREAVAATDPGKSRSARFDGVLAVTRWRGDKKPLFTELTSEGLIRSLGERQTSTVTAGLYLLPASIFEFAHRARARNLSALREFLGMLVDEGVRLGAIEVQEAIDIDEAADLAAAARALGVVQ